MSIGPTQTTGTELDGSVAAAYDYLLVYKVRIETAYKV